jgi:hypothetical protein
MSLCTRWIVRESRAIASLNLNMVLVSCQVQALAFFSRKDWAHATTHKRLSGRQWMSYLSQRRNPLDPAWSRKVSTLYQPAVYPLHCLNTHGQFRTRSAAFNTEHHKKVGTVEIFPLLGCYTEIFGNLLLKYRDYLSVQSSSVTPRNNECRVCVLV